MKCLIVGGGISGLVCALSLAKHQIQSCVIEQRDFIDTSGAGIQLSPNATDLLQKLDLSSPLDSICDRPEFIRIRNGVDNRLLASVRLNETLNVPYYHVLRASLIELLVGSARVDPCIELVANTRVTKVDNHSESVSVATLDETKTGDLLIGCDGAQSFIAKNFLSHPSKNWSGFAAYRAVIEPEGVPDSFTNEPQLLLDVKKHVVTYPLVKDEKVNCVFVVPEQSPVNESWVSTGELERLKKLFRSWSSESKELISAIPPEKLFKWGLYHDPSVHTSWVKNRMALAGDACHTILPFAAQGAALAIEDTVFLSSLLTQLNDTSSLFEVLHKYESVRSKRARLVKQMSRINQSVFHAPNWLSGPRNLSLPLGSWLIKRLIYDYRLPEYEAISQ